MPGPSVTRAIRGGATFVDRRAARLGLRLERPALLSFLFHSLFESKDEIEEGSIHPQEAVTEADFRRFVEHLLAAGYRFVSLAEVEHGLDDTGRYACVTFDDGYANNLRLVGALSEYRVPVTIFVSTNHVDQGRRFWWDAVYCERRRRGVRADAIDREIEFLKTLQPSAIDARLREEFGHGVLVPQGELDRPLTPDELRQLAGNEWVEIGNHTMDHAILTVVPVDEIRRQITGAQHYLERLLGMPIRAVLYPNGDYDDNVLRIAREAGLTCGITTVRRKERPPFDRERLLSLGRFQLQRGLDLNEQLGMVRSEIQLANAARRVRARRAGR